VKDHGDDFNLTTNDVMRVARLADKDRAVYRYVRRIFSPQFAPIDRDNIWHQILEEVRPTEVWQKLAARTERDENRASARSKAGHASRRTSETSAVFSLPNDGDKSASEATAPATSSDSVTGNTNDSSASDETNAAETNTGCLTTVAKSSKGLGKKTTSVDALVNRGQATSVAPTSTTYYQELTTTTTGVSEELPETNEPDQASSIEGIDPGLPPDDRRDEDATVRLFDEANSRPSTAAARRHLKRIADDFADLAQGAGVSGWALVGSAIDEAVSSGSAFVAPKRVREIVTRWNRDGVPAMYAFSPPHGDDEARDGSRPVTGTRLASHRSVRTVDLPGTHDPVDIWDSTCRSLSESLPKGVVEALRADVWIAGYAVGEVTLVATTNELAACIRDDWEDLIQRKLSVALRRPVRIAVTVAGPDDPDPEPVPENPSPRSPRKPGTRRTAPVGGPPAAPRAIPYFMVAECGMSSTQVWTSVLDDLRGSGAIPKAEVDTWLRDSELIGRDPGNDAFIVGVPHALAERRAARFLSQIESAAMQIVGFDCEIQIVRTQTWLAAREEATGTEG
jgi:hypothetical protein